MYSTTVAGHQKKRKRCLPIWTKGSGAKCVGSCASGTPRNDNNKPTCFAMARQGKANGDIIRFSLLYCTTERGIGGCGVQYPSEVCHTKRQMLLTCSECSRGSTVAEKCKRQITERCEKILSCAKWQAGRQVRAKARRVCIRRRLRLRLCPTPPFFSGFPLQFDGDEERTK